MIKVPNKLTLVGTDWDQFVEFHSKFLNPAKMQSMHDDIVFVSLENFDPMDLFMEFIDNNIQFSEIIFTDDNGITETFSQS